MASFQADLAWSQAQAESPMWEAIYREAFPAFATMAYVGDSPQQRDGVDRIVTTTNGHVHRIDEKALRKEYGDFFLEFWSNRENRRPGWVAKDMACDFIAYAFIPSQRCYLLPFPSLRRAWAQNFREWVERYGSKNIPNHGYTTVGTPVPIPVVLDAIRDAMLIRWTSPANEPPEVIGGFSF